MVEETTPAVGQDDPTLLRTTLKGYAAGTGTVPWAEVTALVSSWTWAPRAPTTEPWGDARLDPPGSFADVEAAYTQDLISVDEYKQLYDMSRTHVS